VKGHNGLPIDAKYSFEQLNIVIFLALIVKIRLWFGAFLYLLCIPLVEYLMVRYLTTPNEHNDLAQLI
jgi:hypothetical protein